ncbi:MAG: hypothetical protein ACKO0X_03765 [Bacteroidota bacterium]
MVKLRLSVLTLLIFATQIASAQELPRTPFKDRLYFGGNLGLQFGSATYIDLSPLVGYKITEKLSAGLGITYIYYNIKESANNYGYETSIYGGRVFGRYHFLDNLFAHAETEVLNMEVPARISGTNQYTLVRENITSVLAGGGYAQPIGERSALVMMLLWNFNEDQYSPYQNPIFRIGFNAGF